METVVADVAVLGVKSIVEGNGKSLAERGLVCVSDEWALDILGLLSLFRIARSVELGVTGPKLLIVATLKLANVLEEEERVDESSGGDGPVISSFARR